jgi:hypothetical protein
MKRLALICMLGALAMPVSAMQQTPPPPTQPSQAQPQGRGASRGTPTIEGQEGGRGSGGGRGTGGVGGVRYDAASLQNVRVEVTLTDTLPVEGPSKKSISMVVIDGTSGAIRSQGPSNLTLNIDAQPHVRPDGRIYLSFSIFYLPDSINVPSGQQRQPANVQESLTVLLTDGKPMTVSQSADPRSDRRVTVEVMATVMK